MCTSLSLEHAPCAQGKGQSFVILSQEIIHFASQQSSRMTGILWKVIGLVQGFSKNEFRGQNWMCVVGGVSSYMSAMCSEISAQN